MRGNRVREQSENNEGETENKHTERKYIDKDG